MKTTFSRTFFSASVLLLAALLSVGIFFQLLLRNYLKDQAQTQLKNNAETISDLAAAYFSDSALTRENFFINLAVATQVSGADAIICDRAGRLVLCSDSPLGCSHQGLVIEQAFLSQVLEQGYAKRTGLIQGLYSDKRYVVATPIIQPNTKTAMGIVIVSTPFAQTQAVLQRLSDIYVFVSVLVIFISVIVMSLYAKSQSAPLREMAKAASAFGHGDLRARVPIAKNGSQELQELSLAFNNMAVSLEKSEYQRKEFVTNVSHELKTPMTTISGLVDGVLDGTIPQDKHRHYLQIVSDETKRLSRLVRSMLDISRLQDQGGIPEEKRSRFDLCECAGRVLITFEQKITEKGLEVQVELPEHPVYTNADPDAITQVIYNLLDNAVKFCPAGGLLSLTLRTGTEKVYLSVGNSGQTIPAEELPLVFDRFHKLDKSRTQKEGWGLGLYIVKTIVCSHGEDISVTSAEGKTEFTFTLPLIH